MVTAGEKGAVFFRKKVILGSASVSPGHREVCCDNRQQVRARCAGQGGWCRCWEVSRCCCQMSLHALAWPENVNPSTLRSPWHLAWFARKIRPMEQSHVCSSSPCDNICTGRTMPSWSGWVEEQESLRCCVCRGCRPGGSDVGGVRTESGVKLPSCGTWHHSKWSTSAGTRFYRRMK